MAPRILVPLIALILMVAAVAVIRATYRVRLALRISLRAGILVVWVRAGPLTREFRFPPPEKAPLAPDGPPVPGPPVVDTARLFLPGAIRLLSRIKLSHLRWRTSMGLSDAAQLARASGFLWLAKSSVVAALSAREILEGRPVLSVTPRFNEMSLCTDLQCIVAVRGGDIISALAATGSQIPRYVKEVGIRWPRGHIPSKA